MKESLGQRELQQVAEERGISQAKVAELIGVDASVVSRWLETDPQKRQTKPSLEHALKVQALFGIEPGAWHSDVEPTTEPKSAVGE